MHGGIFIAFTRILNSRLVLCPRNSEFRCRFFVWLFFFSYYYAAKLTGMVNVAHDSVAPQNVITVEEQIM